jgi:CheY-like chemotaxis protein
MDLNLPKLRGDEATRLLRAKGFSQPIVALTGALARRCHAPLLAWIRSSRSPVLTLALVLRAANVLRQDIEACLDSGM